MDADWLGYARSRLGCLWHYPRFTKIRHRLPGTHSLPVAVRHFTKLRPPSILPRLTELVAPQAPAGSPSPFLRQSTTRTIIELDRDLWYHCRQTQAPPIAATPQATRVMSRVVPGP